MDVHHTKEKQTGMLGNAAYQTDRRCDQNENRQRKAHVSLSMNPKWHTKRKKNQTKSQIKINGLAQS